MQGFQVPAWSQEAHPGNTGSSWLPSHASGLVHSSPAADSATHGPHNPWYLHGPQRQMPFFPADSTSDVPPAMVMPKPETTQDTAAPTAHTACALPGAAPAWQHAVRRPRFVQPQSGAPKTIAMGGSGHGSSTALPAASVAAGDAAAGTPALGSPCMSPRQSTPAVHGHPPPFPAPPAVQPGSTPSSNSSLPTVLTQAAPEGPAVASASGTPAVVLPCGQDASHTQSPAEMRMPGGLVASAEQSTAWALDATTAAAMGSAGSSCRQQSPAKGAAHAQVAMHEVQSAQPGCPAHVAGVSPHEQLVWQRQLQLQAHWEHLAAQDAALQQAGWPATMPEAGLGPQGHGGMQVGVPSTHAIASYGTQAKSQGSVAGQTSCLAMGDHTGAAFVQGGLQQQQGVDMLQVLERAQMVAAMHADRLSLTQVANVPASLPLPVCLVPACVDHILALPV